MMYRVYSEAQILYEGSDFREAFSSWNKHKGLAKINVPIHCLPKLQEGDDFHDSEGVRYIVEDYEVRMIKSGSEIVYHVFDESGRKKRFSSSDVAKFSGGGIVNDYQRIKEGLIFKNEYLAQLVEVSIGKTPEIWFERVGAMIYASNKKYLDWLESKVREILTKIEDGTGYVSKMINNKPIRKYVFSVEYDDGNEVLTVMTFSETEARRVALKKVSEKNLITRRKMKKIQILAVQK